MANQPPSELLHQSNGKTLYAVAWEDWGKHKRAGVFYLHAHNTGDARATLVRNFRQLGKRSRVVGVAPAIGGYITEEQKTRVYMP